jgi:hypothetical protein
VRLLITGSRHGFPRLAEALDAFVGTIGNPDEVHIRGQRGVDTEARTWVAARGLLLVPEASDPARPSPARYHEANQRMVDKCGPGDIAVGFPAIDSRGTWDCLVRARRAGLRCYVADPHTRKITLWG